MPSTHTAKTLLTSQALAAAASVNTTQWDLSTAYGGLFAVRLTNGTTPPTTVPVVKFFVGEATGVKRQFYTAAGDSVASSVNDIVCELPLATMFANCTITWGATTGGTVESYGQELTSI